MPLYLCGKKKKKKCIQVKSVSRLYHQQPALLIAHHSPRRGAHLPSLLPRPQERRQLRDRKATPCTRRVTGEQEGPQPKQGVGLQSLLRPRAKVLLFGRQCCEGKENRSIFILQIPYSFSHLRGWSRLWAPGIHVLPASCVARAPLRGPARRPSPRLPARYQESHKGELRSVVPSTRCFLFFAPLLKFSKNRK